MKMLQKKNVVEFLKNKALLIRIDSIRATTAAGSGHPTSCLSAADLMSVLFFHVLAYDYAEPTFYNNDRFILSKGHAVPALYAALKNLAVISDDELLSMRKFTSDLEGHPTPRFRFNEAATGSLGQGLSVGIGMALNARLKKLPYTTYVLMGDGESAEGSVWEAAECAATQKLTNLVGMIDCNRLGQAGETLDGHDIEHHAAKWSAFGWEVHTVDGHCIEEIMQTFEQVKTATRPTMILAKTFKGYGLEDRENKNGFHGKPLSSTEALEAIAHLKARFKTTDNHESFTPQAPEKSAYKKTSSPRITLNLSSDPAKGAFEKGKLLSTRKAYGYALVALGHASENVVALDADVKNSTFSELFEKEFPHRFIECFIAEQNMVGISAGFALRGMLPFASTFGTFFARAFDQIRMSAIGRVPLRLCGSHSGVSIGEDGPSQMALEDIAIMRTLPSSIVLYPSDGISTYKLMECAVNYHEGISYLRTTRQDTPVIYDETTTFTPGGCHVLRKSAQDRVCIIGAGITLHHALAAYEALKKESVFVSVIDLYSVKPLDAQTIIKTAQQSGNKIITVEDHYQAGGIGEAIAAAYVNHTIAVHSLCVRKLPRSGTPTELLAFEEIDTAAIVKAVKNAIL